MKRKTGLLTIVLILLSASFLASCTTLSSKKVNAKWSDSNFWFSLDPLLLTKENSYEVHAFVAGKEDFDSLFLKSEILIQSIENGTASQFYKKDQINYELKQTVSQIDTLDPINSFSGPDIGRAEAAYNVMLEKRQKLIDLMQ